MYRSNHPLDSLPDLEALLRDPARFKNRLVWSMVLAPPLTLQRLARQRAQQEQQEQQAVDSDQVDGEGRRE